MARRLSASLFGAAVAGALVFGAAQALAAPAARPAQAERLCSDPERKVYCRQPGYLWGDCGWSGIGPCECYNSQPGDPERAS
jgi:hypothetical protein